MTSYINFFSLMSPTWVLQDIVLYLVAGMLVFFWMKKSPDKAPYLFLELVAFIFLYSGVFENLAVAFAHYYSYGTSLIMVGNVPLGMLLMQALPCVAGLPIVESMRVPTWCKPFLVGYIAFLKELSVDPLAAVEYAHVNGGVSARWQWYTAKPGMASMFNEPIYNWTGWLPIILLATSFFLLGRWWFKKSNGHPLVGLVYPFISMLASLLLLTSPLITFLGYLSPFFAPGSVGEWIMFVFDLSFPVILLLVFWRGRMQRPLLLRETWPLFGVFVFLHASDLVVALAGRYWNVLWIVVAATTLNMLILLTIYLCGRRVQTSEQELIMDPAINLDDLARHK